MNIAAASAGGMDVPVGILYLPIAAVMNGGSREKVGQEDCGKSVSCAVYFLAPISMRIAPRSESSLERLSSVLKWDRAIRKAASWGRTWNRVLGT